MEHARRRQDPEALRAHFLQSSETTPTRRVWRGAGGPWHLQSEAQDLGSLELAGDGLRTLDSFLAESESTAILVLHRGNVVYERYMRGMRPHDLHVTASMSKSLVGLLGAVLARERQLDRGRALHHYVPELAGTAFGDAAVDHLLHMATAVRYEGRPFNKESEAQRFFTAVGILPRPHDYNGPRNLMERLSTAHAEHEPGTIFRYENGNTEALAEAIRRVTGASLSELLSDVLWSKIGAQEDALFGLDGQRREIACGRFAATLRDIARVGELLRCGGALGAHQVLPEEIVRGIPTIPAGPAHDVLGPGDRRINSPVMAYHDFWWVPYNDEGAFVARGRSGQRLYVSPERETVIAHFGAHVIDPAVPVPQFEHVFRQIAHHLSHGS
ncbi:Beta-lactamase [Sinomonas atrocyanea]|uniref:Beta-lactamase n=1 Tax=Sinomonas atrocyanea TaxID=37927 RepID=A0A127A297_9MICC|nr:serine hydrolase [Sinomonas atrocyanea]AMM32914.1 Beta-lactamase [Sinomonas atrocyanea]GEB65035.1 amide hydrolase [Sinomonas atrocyanea]GGG61314.1 amide hydrolase [Sinomonas atrocyanea]